MPYLYGRKGQSADEINVSRYGVDPWRRLSPFCPLPEPIPIPGYASYLDEGILSDFPEWCASSVEGLWQGLKKIDGETDPGLFRGRPRKRRGRPSGHDFGNYRLLDYDRAKALIYIPSYLAQLRLLAEVLERLRGLAETGEVHIVDVSFQPDVLGPKPISHAALLVDYLQGKLAPYEAAHASLRERAARFEACYEESTLQNSSTECPAASEFRSLGERVLELAVPERLGTYASCAREFERESLMLMASRAVGSSDELSHGRSLFQAWVVAGLLTEEEARALSQAAPVCRWTDQWLDL